MNEKQNEHLTENSDEPKQYEIEVTIKPSISSTNTMQAKQTNTTINPFQTNMAGNRQPNQNVSQITNNSNMNVNKEISNNNLMSRPNNAQLLNNMSFIQKAFQNSPNGSLALDHTMLFLLKTIREASANNNNININNVQPQVQLQKKVAPSQPAAPLKQPINPSFPQTQIHVTPAPPISPPISPPSTQINNMNNMNNVNNKSHIRIGGYRFNQNNQLEYQCFPDQDIKNQQTSPNSNSFYCSSDKMNDFESIRQFWLRNNGYNEKSPRTPIVKPKKKKKKTIRSYLDYSSYSPPDSPRIKASEKPQKQVARYSGSKVSAANLPVMLSIDKEPKVNVLGIVQTTPIIKIAVKMMDSDDTKVFTAAEARKLFPMQLSKYYEQFITFVDYE